MWDPGAGPYRPPPASERGGARWDAREKATYVVADKPVGAVDAAEHALGEVDKGLPAACGGRGRAEARGRAEGGKGGGVERAVRAVGVGVEVDGLAAVCVRMGRVGEGRERQEREG